MRLILLRHGIATSLAPNGDESRPLTPDGIGLIKVLSRRLISRFIPADSATDIFASPLQRTVETAHLLNEALLDSNRPDPHMVITSTLKLGVDKAEIESFLNDLNRRTPCTVLVSHEPELCFITSRLTGISDSSVVFDRGGAAVIDLSPTAPVIKGALLALLPIASYDDLK